MRTDNIKKYVLPNIPYLFVLWACLKLGTAYRLWYGKAPEDFNEADVARFMAETEAILQKRELLGGRDDAKTIAQQLAEGRAQAARENAARPVPAKGKEARDDR